MALFNAMAFRATAATPVVTRGPYLQQNTATSVILRWRSDTTNIGRVRLGTDAASLVSFADETVATTNHLVLITNLLPDTIYFYSVGLTNQALAGGTNYFFRTAPAPGSTRSFRVWVLGDFGFTNESAGLVRDAYYNFTAGHYTDLFLMLGDNAYHGGSDGVVWQRAVFDTYSNILRQTPAWSCIGNQETGNSTTASPSTYLENFTFPTNAEAGGVASGSERYYSFNFGNVHFICLDSMSSPRTNGSAMLMWLEADLAQTTSDWVVAFWHHPPYSKGSNNSDDAAKVEQFQMRANALPILEAHGVDLVLGGHSHTYERSYLIDGHYGVSSTFSTNTMLRNGGDGRVDGTGSYDKPALSAAPHQGAVFLVAGSGAQVNLTGATLNHPVMFRSLPNLGSVVLDFNANRLDSKFIRENGVIADYFTMTKGGTPLRILSAQSAGQNLSLSWQTVAQRIYRVQGAATLGATWTNLPGPLTGDGKMNSFTVPRSSAGNGFYRLSTSGNP